MGVPPVRPHGADEHARVARAWVPEWCASKGPPRAGAVDRLQRPIRLSRPVCWRAARGRRGCRNVACAGGQPIGATNCLNFGNPEKPEIMWQFARAVEGMGDRVPRARHSDHRAATSASKTRPMARRSCRRRCLVWSGSSRTPPSSYGGRFAAGRRRRRPPRREPRRSSGGSEYLQGHPRPHCVACRHALDWPARSRAPAVLGQKAPPRAHSLRTRLR